MRNEIGAAVCRFPGGRLAFGPWARGTPTSVNVPLQCPPGATLSSIYHTHPGGVAYPSDQDVASARQAGVKSLCINADGDLKCFRASQRR